MTKKIIYTIAIGLVILIGVATFLYAPKKSLEAEKVHYHAGFVVFQDNKKLDFSNFKYMAIVPCTVDDKEPQKDESPENIQNEKAHLHDNVGDVIHVEEKGAIWKDLFTNIKFDIDYGNTTGYINGKAIPDFQLQPIDPYDSLVVFIGKNNQNLLSQAVSTDYIKETGEKSTSCGD